MAVFDQSLRTSDLCADDDSHFPKGITLALSLQASAFVASTRNEESQCSPHTFCVRNDGISKVRLWLRTDERRLNRSDNAPGPLDTGRYPNGIAVRDGTLPIPGSDVTRRCWWLWCGGCNGLHCPPSDDSPEPIDVGGIA